MRRLRRFGQHQGGATAVEFALIAMVMFAVTVGTIELGRAMLLYNTLAHGADRAARLVMVHPTETDAQLRDRWDAERERFSIGIPADLFPAFGAVTGVYRPVTLSYQFQPMIGGLAFPSGYITISATRRVPVS